MSLMIEDYDKKVSFILKKITLGRKLKCTVLCGLGVTRLSIVLIT